MCIMISVSPPAFFIRPFYKMMLNKAVTLDDMQSVVSDHMTTTRLLATQPINITIDHTHRTLNYGTVSRTS